MMSSEKLLKLKKLIWSSLKNDQVKFLITFLRLIYELSSWRDSFEEIITDANSCGFVSDVFHWCFYTSRYQCAMNTDYFKL